MIFKSSQGSPRKGGETGRTKRPLTYEVEVVVESEEMGKGSDSR